MRKQEPELYKYMSIKEIAEHIYKYSGRMAEESFLRKIALGMNLKINKDYMVKEGYSYRRGKEYKVILYHPMIVRKIIDEFENPTKI